MEVVAFVGEDRAFGEAGGAGGVEDDVGVVLAQVHGRFIG